MPETHKVGDSGRPFPMAALWAAGLYGLALLALFHQTAGSMLAIWLRSETFAHGLLILPISLWLIWRKRDELALLQPRPVPWVTALLLVPGLVWIVAWMVDVLVVQQLALVAMLVLGVWAILGHQLARALAFPLLFLFLAVPMGEPLILPMMEFTATTTVWLIHHTGIPVYREGMYFSLPSGNWSVVEACSGVRYIIASFTLGVLYAYLTYRTPWRRLAFVLASLVVPVIANTLRAYIIVILGHWSDMKIATGVDHLIYGWVFFGIVMFLLFWFGALFREDHDGPPAASPAATIRAGASRVSLPKMFTIAFVALSVPAVLLLLFSLTSPAGGTSGSLQRIALPEATGSPLSPVEPPWQWRPHALVTGEAAAYYPVEEQLVGLYVQFRDGRDDDGEVVGSAARFVQSDTEARVVGRSRVEVQFNGRTFQVEQAELLEPGGALLAWSWYRIGNMDTSNDYVAKFAEARVRLESGTEASCRIVIAVPMPDSIQSSQAVLQAFLNQHGARLDEALTLAMGGGEL